jgi:hypothetical protein
MNNKQTVVTEDGLTVYLLGMAVTLSSRDIIFAADDIPGWDYFQYDINWHCVDEHGVQDGPIAGLASIGKFRQSKQWSGTRDGSSTGLRTDETPWKLAARLATDALGFD